MIFVYLDGKGNKNEKNIFKMKKKHKILNLREMKIFFYIETINFKENETTNIKQTKQETSEHNYDKKYLL